MDSAAKQRHYVRIIAQRAVQVHDERRFAMHPQSARGKHGTLDAMRAAMPDHRAHGMDRLAVQFVVDRNRIDERLDFLRCRQPL